MPIHIETQEIRVFKAVYEQHGFKKAADKLHVTQSAVSQTISNLEKKLDTLLLERTNPLTLTETGIRLLHYAEAVLSEEENVLTDIVNIRNGILSTLLLAMNSTVGQLYADELMKCYCQDNPLTRLKIDVMPSRQIVTAIRSDLWELGFGPFQQQMPDYFTTLPLFTDSRKLVISGTHPLLPSLECDTESAIQSIPLIVSHLDNPDLRPTEGKLRDSFGTIWEVNSLSLRQHLVAQGMGMSYIDSRILTTDPTCRDFVVLDQLPFSVVELTFGIYHRASKHLSAGARQFMDICREFDFETSC